MKEEKVRELLALNLKRNRTKAGLSQLALANRVGLAHNFINDIEHGKKWVSPDTIARLCDALALRPGELFLEEKPTEAVAEKVLPAYCAEVREAVLKAIDEVERRHGY